MSTWSPANPLSDPQPWDWVADSYVDTAMPLLGLFVEVAIERAMIGPSCRVW